MRMSRREGRESAFTIVEVLVAALIVTAVFAGAMYFVIGSGKSQQKSLVRQRMAAVADDISQRVRADQQWLKQKPGCSTSECDVSSLFRVAPPKPGDPQLDASVRIRPVDGEADGVGTNDQDNVTPDFYRIMIRVTMATSEQEKWGAQAPFDTVSTVDATALGRATGSLVVQTCEAVNQVDERMSIARCEGGGGRTQEMKKQPEPCKSPFPMSWNDWLTARPVLPLGCNAAYDSARAKDEYLASVHARGVTNLPFRLERDDRDGGPSTARLQSNADTVSGDGTYVFSGLPAGTYRVIANPGSGRELWKTHTIPSAGRTSVQANQQARALVMVRPKQGLGSYGARFTRTVYLYRLDTETASESYEETYDGTRVRTVTTFTYLVGEGPVKERWDGPAWTGILSMEPKPFDRYRDDSAVVSQPTIVVPWEPRKADNGGWNSLGPLPTGLHSLPGQQPTPVPAPSDLWGSFGIRSHDCIPGVTPGGSCGGFAWLDHRPGKVGGADSTVSYHSEDGECYLQSSVTGFSFARRLQNGGGHAERCSRDLHYVNPTTGKKTSIPGFLPDKNGNGGGRMLLSMRQSTSCIAGCEGISGSGTGGTVYGDPNSNTVAPKSSSKPRGSASPPKLTRTRTQPATPTSPAKTTTKSLPAASAVPSAGGGGSAPPRFP